MVSLRLAAPPANVEESGRLDGAKVSEHEKNPKTVTYPFSMKSDECVFLHFLDTKDHGAQVGQQEHHIYNRSEVHKQQLLIVEQLKCGSIRWKDANQAKEKTLKTYDFPLRDLIVEINRQDECGTNTYQKQQDANYKCLPISAIVRNISRSVLYWLDNEKEAAIPPLSPLEREGDQKSMPPVCTVATAFSLSCAVVAVGRVYGVCSQSCKQYFSSYSLSLIPQITKIIHMYLQFEIIA
ncbi:hypothetical protein C0J52_12184 [Blattella germanica]|nr:hypothetical protein C0J52_12184 [Blattella germanica]